MSNKRIYPLRHGLYVKDISKRINRSTRAWINERVRLFLEDIDHPSERQIALAEHTAFLDAITRSYAIMVLAGEFPGSVNRYLSFEGHLQRNLCALGLSKRKKDPLTLESYLREKSRKECKE